MGEAIENILAGIAILAACILGGWQLWPSITSRKGKVAFVVLLSSVSLVTIILMLASVIVNWRSPEPTQLLPPSGSSESVPNQPRIDPAKCEDPFGCLD